jgi:hypothetical protein
MNFKKLHDIFGGYEAKTREYVLVLYERTAWMKPYVVAD